jgi:hypothetical protein
MRRSPGAALGRLARLIPGVASRLDREAAEYEEAMRQAFQAGTSPRSRKLPVPARIFESSASTVGAARPVAFVPVPPAPPTSAATPAIEPAGQSEHAKAPSRRHGGQAGETAPDFLLRTPKSVIPIADDFFDGLIRRVEGKR